jgi:hypothetical protein
MGRWYAKITHCCPLPGQETAAIATVKEKNFNFQAVPQESQLLAFFFPWVLGTWGGDREGGDTEEGNSLVSCLWENTSYLSLWNHIQLTK